MELVNNIRHRILWVLVIVIFGVLGGLGYGYLTGGGYTATARLIVVSSARDAVEAAQGDVAAQARLKTYAALASAPELQEFAAKRSGTGVSGAYVAGQVKTVPVPETVLLEIRANAPGSAEAAAIADAVGVELISVVRKIELPLGGGEPSLALQVVQPANADIVRVPKVDVSVLGLGGLIGLIFGLAIAGVVPRRHKHPVPSASGDQIAAQDSGGMSLSENDQTAVNKVHAP